MTRQPRISILRMVLFALAVATLAGCTPQRRWEAVSFEVEALPIEAPLDESKLKPPVPLEAFEFSLRHVARETVGDPNISVPRRLTLVRSLGVNADPKDDCTGFFISKRVFLTAKHCVPQSQAPSKISVDLGEKLGTKKAKCARFPSPEPWKDWAICTFGEDLDLGDPFILTGCVPRASTKVIIMGFCELRPLPGGTVRAAAPAEQPNAGVLEILAPEGGFLPAQSPDGGLTTACILDSGGPAVVPERLVKAGDHYVPSGKISAFGLISAFGTCPDGDTRRTCIAPTTDEGFAGFLKETTGLTIPACSE